MLNLFNKHPIKAENDLEERLRSIYWKYRQFSRDADVKLETVIEAHCLFSQLIKYTGPLVDEYEFKRRLMSKGGDLNNRETLAQKVDNTSSWMEALTSITAGQAENIIHNLYYCVQLHSFSRKVTQTFENIDQYCERVEKAGIA